MIRDQFGAPIPVLSFSGDPIVLGIATSSASTTLTPSTIYRIYATVDCFIKLGTGTVVATNNSHPLSANLPEFFSCDSINNVLAVIGTSAGTLYISEMSAI